MKSILEFSSKLHKFMVNLDEAGFTLEDFQNVINAKGNKLAKKMFKAIMEEKEISASSHPLFKLEIDGTKALNQLIAGGKYGWKDPDITEKHFPIKRKTKRTATIKIFHFNCGISSGDVIKEMRKDGFRPATIEELLALGAEHPNLQKEFPIIALGSRWQQFPYRRLVPGLSCFSRVRRLVLISWLEPDWRSQFRFAALLCPRLARILAGRDLSLK